MLLKSVFIFIITIVLGPIQVQADACPREVKIIQGIQRSHIGYLCQADCDNGPKRAYACSAVGFPRFVPGDFLILCHS